MDSTVTIITLTLALAIASVSAWRDARPPSHKPRLVPWRLLLILSGAASLFMAVHLLDLAGISLPRNQGAP